MAPIVFAWLLFLLAGCKDEVSSPWDFVPTASVAVLENFVCSDQVNRLLLLSDERLQWLDSLSVSCFAGWVNVDKNKTEPFFVVNRQVADVWSRLKKSGMAEPEARRLNGLEFYIFKKDEFVVALLQTKDFFVFSENPLVIELVIRGLSEKNRKAKGGLEGLQNVPKLKIDQGNLYVDWRQGPPSSWLPGGMSVFDVRLNNTLLTLDGFTLPDTGRISRPILSWMALQKPVALTLQNVVPIETTGFLHLGLSDPALWHDHHEQFLLERHPLVLDSLTLHRQETGFSSKRFFEAIDGEVGFVSTARGNLIICKLKEVAKAAGELKKLMPRAPQTSDEPNQYFLERGETVQHIFWPLASSFSEIHYGFEENILVMADSQAALQLFFQRLNLDQTWGRTLAWKQFHQSMLAEANISYFFSQAAAAPPLPVFSNSRFIRGHAQFTSLDKQFYTSMLLEYGAAHSPIIGAQRPPDSAATLRVSLEEAIQSPAYPVINHQTKEEEIIFTDVRGNLRLISGLTPRWSQPVGEIQSGIYQIDFFRNRKLQYVFLAGQKLHLVDRLGRPVSGFPVNIPKGRIIHFAVVDYDQSRNYRFLVLFDGGQAFLLDGKGRPLEGWNPRIFPEKIQSIQFQRMRGKDYFTALSKRKLYLTNRKGEMIAGFPVEVKEDVSPVIFADVRLGVWQLLTQSGRIVSYRPDGVQDGELILPRNSVEAKFFRVVSDTDVFSVRLDRGKIAVFGAGTEIIFEAENPGSNRISGLAVGGNKPIFVFFDEEQQLVYVLSGRGASAIREPLESSRPPQIYSSAQAGSTLYTVQGTTIVATPLSDH